MNLCLAASILFINIITIETIFGAPDPIEEPSCSDVDPSDGSYPAFACKGAGSNGRCFCCSPSRHERIFGWFWTSFAENATCACSRQRDDLEVSSVRKDISIHCMENGNYDELQCDNGLCWCVESKSGKPTERIYPRSMRRYLPCYAKKPSDLRQHYERECESAALARIMVLRKLEAHGTKGSHIEMPRCDYDGSYSAFKYDKKRVLCTWKDGKQIGLLGGNIADVGTMNCNCARDSVIYANENIEFEMICGANGNYDPSQISNGRPFCVDSDGYPTTQLGEVGEILNCA